MFGYVYETTNLINEKKYIGKRELKEFDKNYFGSGKLLQRSIKKYGKENFRVIELDRADSRKELCEKEKYYIDKFDASKSNLYYNIALGGDGGDTLSSLSKEDFAKYSKKKSDDISKRRYIHLEDIDKFVRIEELNSYLDKGWILGRSDKAKENISRGAKEAKKNFEFTVEIRYKMGSANRGKNLSEETKKKMSDYWKGKPKLWARKPKSEETKRKMSESAKLRSQKSNFNLGAHNKGKKMIYKDNKIKYVFEDDLKIFLKEGWIKGTNRKRDRWNRFI